MAVSDGHVFSLEVLYTPCALAGGWTALMEPRRWLDSTSLVQLASRITSGAGGS
jgi:hypothetical protein